MALEGQQHLWAVLSTLEPTAEELGTCTATPEIAGQAQVAPQGDMELAPAAKPSCTQSGPSHKLSTDTGDFLAFPPQMLAKHITWMDVVRTGLQVNLLGLHSTGSTILPPASKVSLGPEKRDWTSVKAEAMQETEKPTERH